MKKLYIFITILLFVTELTAQQIGYQQNDSTIISYKHLNEIKISAEKTNQKVLELPLSVTAINSEIIEKNKIENTFELTSRIPNFYMPDYGMKLSKPIFIRGIGTKYGEPSVGLYIDHVASFDKNTLSFSLNNIERIEVLRGPQGTLFGRNAMGGVINIITKNPKNKTAGNIDVGFGNYNSQTYNLSFSTPINSQTLFFIFNANHNKRDGFTKNTFIKDDADYINNINGNFKLRFLPTSEWDISLNTRFDRTRDGGYAYGIFNDDYKYATTSYNSDSYFDRDMFNSSLSIERKFNGVNFISVSSFQNYDFTQVADQDHSATDIYSVENYTDQNLFTQEFNLKGNSEKINWLIGSYFYIQNKNENVKVNYGIPTFKGLENKLQVSGLKSAKKLTFGEFDRYGIAFFGQSTIKNILPNIDFLFGLRYSKESNDFDRRENYDLLLDKQISAAPTSKNLENATSQVLPKVSIKYKLNTNTNFYTSLAKGYRSGGFNTIYDTEDNIEFKAEESLNYELGFKSNLIQNKLNINGSVFYIDINDQQLSEILDGRGVMTKNAGKSHSSGFELELMYSPINNLFFTGSFGYTNVEFDKYNAILKRTVIKEGKPTKEVVPEDELVGNKAPLIPEYTYNLAVDYKYNITKKVNIDFNLSLNGVGKQYFDDLNTLSQDAYKVFNSTIALNFKKYKFSFWAKNILNEEYFTYKYQTSNIKVNSAPPLTFGFNISARL